MPCKRHKIYILVIVFRQCKAFMPCKRRGEMKNLTFKSVTKFPFEKLWIKDTPYPSVTDISGGENTCRLSDKVHLIPKNFPNLSAHNFSQMIYNNTHPFLHHQKIRGTS